MSRKKTTQSPEPGSTPEALEQLEKLGALFFDPISCARIQGRTRDAEKFASELAVGASDAGRAYQTGRLRAEVAVRQVLMNMAHEGSMAHMKQAIQLMTACQQSVEDAK